MGYTVDLIGSGKRDRGRYLEVSRACFLVAVVVRHAQADAISRKYHVGRRCDLDTIDIAKN